MRSLGVILVAGMLVVSARPAGAQASFEVGGLFVSLSGTDFRAVNGGIGGDGQVRFRLGPSPVSVGIGGQYTTHSVDNIAPHFNVWGAFIEPRVGLLPGGSPIRPYLAARGAYLHQSTAQNSTSATANGVLIGGGGGVLLGLGGIHLDVGALVALAKFGEVKINGAGTGFKPNGTVVVFRAGLVFGRL